MTPTLAGISSLECEYTIPDPSEPVQNSVSRWSDYHLKHPALIVVPTSDRDIQAALQVAKDNNLHVVPSGGGHGALVKIDDKTLLLDMKKFNHVQLHKSDCIVTVGGGVTVGPLLRALAADGCYTAVPNSNAVGVVGCVLGGGFTGATGSYGYMSDLVTSFRIITADGRVRHVNSESMGDDLALFHALRGAGSGLGVVTELCMRAFSVSSINDERRVWVRTLVFPASGLADAISCFLSMAPPPAGLQVALTFLRSPPNSPSPGVPIVILKGTYWGAAADAERVASPLLDSELVSKAITATTAMLPVESLNDALKPLDIHGGWKDFTSAYLKSLRRETIESAFAEWLKTTDENLESRPSGVVFNCFNPGVAISHADRLGPRQDFLRCRDRGFVGLTLRWSKRVDGKDDPLSNFAEKMLSIYRDQEADSPAVIPNNMLPETPLSEMFSEDAISELKRVKDVFDKERLFASPYHS